MLIKSLSIVKSITIDGIYIALLRTIIYFDAYSVGSKLIGAAQEDAVGCSAISPVGEVALRPARRPCRSTIVVDPYRAPDYQPLNFPAGQHAEALFLR